jgi:hypothetical protein
MKRYEKRSQKWWRRFNGTRALIWLVMIPVSYYFGWVYGVAFVSVCSLYANVASDVASWRSDVNPQLEAIEAKLDKLLEKSKTSACDGSSGGSDRR